MFAGGAVAGTSRCFFTRPAVGRIDVFFVAGGLRCFFTRPAVGVLMFFRGGWVALLLYPPYGGAY
jgi:hypothetical protein